MTWAFTTRLGSMYFMNDDGTFGRNKHDGTTNQGFIYLGSINPSENPALIRIEDADFVDYDAVMSQFASGYIPGFTAMFVKGNQPFGILGPRPEEIIIYGDAQRTLLTWRSPIKVKKYHVGDGIINTNPDLIW